MNQPSSDQAAAVSPLATAPLSDEHRAKIGELLVRWNGVQGRLKRAEQISQIAVIPAINELRYAGRMLVAAMSNTSPTEENGVPCVGDAIVTAGQYVTNAEHDISDALIYHYQKKADDLNERFGAKTIQTEIPNYGQFLDLLSDARKKVIASRANVTKRQENYQELADITDELTKMYFSLVDGEVLFGLEVEHYRARIKLWKSVSVTLALWALIATVLFFII